MPPHVCRVRAFALAAIIALVAGSAARPALAQPQRGGGPRPIAAADYARAERFLAPTVNPLVIGGTVSANWLPDDRFWYRNQVSDGYEFMLVTPAAKSRRLAFDHARLAAALSAAAGASFTAHQLPFTAIELSADGLKVSFDYNGRSWSCDVRGTACADTGAASGRAGTSGRGAGGRGARPAGSGPGAKIFSIRARRR